MAKAKQAKRNDTTKLTFQIVVALIVAYALASLAIDNGSLLVYAAAIIAAGFGLSRVPKFFNK